jgi:diguanylate cyclase (GGDEF)-like protein
MHPTAKERKGDVKSFVEYLNSRSRFTLISIGLLLVALIGIADFVTGHQLSIFIFYLVPVTLVASIGGVWAGLLVSCASALAWLFADLLEARQYVHPFVPYWNAVVRLVFLSIVVFLQTALSREKQVARTDYLTGLANRKFFFEFAEQEIRRARRYESPFSAAYIDLDNFKEINDQYGHDAGDRLLQLVGRVIRNNVRAVDFPARLGGDEFAVLLPQTDAGSARNMLSKLHRLLGEAMNRERWHVTFSCGVATFLKAPESVDEMVRRADSLMYAVKAEGKNAVRYDVFGS